MGLRSEGKVRSEIAAEAAVWVALVVVIHARQVRRQGRALGPLTSRLGRLLLAQQFLKLCLGRRDVGIKGLVEQRTLFDIELLALLAELQASELGVLRLEMRPARK